MNIRDFVKDSLEKFAAKCKEMFGTPVLEVIPFKEGDVTTEQELFSKIKLNGKNITSIEQLIALKDRVFYVNIGGFQNMLNVNTTVSNDYLMFISGTVQQYYEYGSQVIIKIASDNIPGSFIKVYEM